MSNKYKNIPEGEYKSKLERTAATLLTQEGIFFEYEPWEAILIEPFVSTVISYERIGKAFKEQRDKLRRTSYRPDFVGKRWIIETKGRKTPDFMIKWKLFKRYLKENNLNYLLAMPTNRAEIVESINIIKKIVIENDEQF